VDESLTEDALVGVVGEAGGEELLVDVFAGLCIGRLIGG
jgi:hypothetical protein